MPDGGPVLALARDHTERISERPGVGWTPNLCRRSAGARDGTASEKLPTRHVVSVRIGGSR
jgi:hypothetical protein